MRECALLTFLSARMHDDAAAERPARRPTASDGGRPCAAVHLDLDGGPHIFRAHGWSWPGTDDVLFETGLRGAMEVFAQARIRATLFVIAEDLLDRRKLDLIRSAIAAGHEIASHSVTHRRLTTLSSDEKRREIVESRERLTMALSVEVRGFRAPQFGIDRESLEIIDDAGYRYDSSVLPSVRTSGAQDFALADTPYRPLPGRALIELPLPAVGRWALPFHPSYSLVVGDWHFRRGLTRWKQRNAALVMLFHLTDFAEPLSSATVRGWKQRLFTLSYQSAQRKRDRSATMLEFAKRHFTFSDTAQLMTTCADSRVTAVQGMTA